MTDRMKRKRALEKAGYKHVSGWIPKADAPKVQNLIDKAADDVARIMEKEK